MPAPPSISMTHSLLRFHNLNCGLRAKAANNIAMFGFFLSFSFKYEIIAQTFFSSLIGDTGQSCGHGCVFAILRFT